MNADPGTQAWATHRAFGLAWHLPFPFPVFAERDERDEPTPADVVVREGVVPVTHDDAPPSPGAGPDITVDVPDTARMRVSDGTCIELQRHPGCTDEALRLLLMGSGAAVLLHQRGALALHGSGIVTDHGAVLVVGHSRAGKSTLLGAFVERGYPVLCDDLAAITLDGGRPMALPGSRVMKLHADSAQALGWPVEGLPRVRLELDKYLVPIPRQAAAPLPLAAVYQLSTHAGDDVEIVPRVGAARLNAILDHTWQKATIRRMGLDAQHFARAAALADAVPVVAVRRPAGTRPGVSRLAEILEGDLARRC
jgi:hypothetical protein